MATKFDIMGFLQEYQNYPCLWDKSIPEYRNRLKRDYAENCLLQVSNMTSINELKRKIRSIRCTYNQEKAKIKSSMRTGSDSSTLYKPKLVWFPFADSFLKKNLDVDSKSDINLILNDESLVSTFMENSDDSQIQENSIDEKQLNSELKGHKNNLRRPKSTAPKFKRKIVKKFDIDKSLDNVVKTLQNICKDKPKENEFTLFAKHIAAQLEQLPLKEALTVQLDIQCLLTEARIRSMKDSINPIITTTKTNEFHL